MIDTFQIVLFLGDQPPPAVELLNSAYPGVELQEFRKLPSQGSYGLLEHEGFTVAIQCQLSRVDVVVDRPNSEDGSQMPFIEDGDLAAAFDFVRPAIGALCQVLQVERGAILVNKSEFADNAVAAAANLLERVPNLPYPPGALDVEYRVNVPVKSRLDQTIRYNRVGRWFSAKRALVQVSTNQAPVTSKLRDVSILAVDVNVDRDSSLKGFNQSDAFQEMFEIVFDLFEKEMNSFQ